MISGLRYEAQKKKEEAERARLLAEAEGIEGPLDAPSTEVSTSSGPAPVPVDEEVDGQP